jgi:pSer/pThr/pTyr-binding forkhead associated (FHA) protein
MKVQFIPLTKSKGRRVIVVTEWPKVLARSLMKDLTPDAATISEQHCKIEDVDGLLVVRDLGSRYGTYVNEKRVTEATLWPGDKLTVGTVTFLVHYSLTRCCVKARQKAESRMASPRPTATLDQTLPYNGISAAG